MLLLNILYTKAETFNGVVFFQALGEDELVVGAKPNNQTMYVSFAQ